VDGIDTHVASAKLSCKTIVEVDTGHTQRLSPSPGKVFGDKYEQHFSFSVHLQNAHDRLKAKCRQMTCLSLPVVVLFR
jgi:hypothetical protein